MTKRMVFATAIIFLFPVYIFPQTSDENWIKMPPGTWPAIALVNDVRYKNGDTHQDTTVSYAGSSFLLKWGMDTLAVTAKHILFAARNRATDRVMINHHLQKWKMYPKNHPQDSVIIGRLINEDESEVIFRAENGVLQRDWIVLTTNYISPQITPLTLSEREMQLGDRVHLTGNPYRFEETLTVPGTITKIEGNQLIVNFDGMEKALLKNGEKEKAIATLRRALGEVYKDNKPEIKKMLMEIQE